MGIYNSNIDFNKYKYFYAVAEQESFSKASEVLHISQPAISHSVKELEEQLGVKLFNRDSKKVTLTENGKKLLTYVDRAFSNIIMAEKSLQESSSELTGNVRVGIYSHISLFMLPKLIKEFNEKYPYSSFDISISSSSELKEKLLNKELDFIIVQYPIFMEHSNYTEEVLCELENCFFASKKYYDTYMNSDKKLEEFTFILPTKGYDDIDSLEKVFKNKNLIIKKNFRVYTMELIKKLVIEDIGIGWGLKKCIEKELNKKILYEIPTELPLPNTTFSICYNKNLLNKTSLEFFNELKLYFNKNFK